MHPLLFNIQQIVFPHYCINCKEKIYGKDYFLCLHCNDVMPFTGDYYPQNATEKILFGRFNFQFAHSLLYFQKANIAQSIMHELKYNNAEEVGEWLGYKLGEFLNTKNLNTAETILLPVPLSTKKIRQRGYNQSEIIAQGIHEVTNIPIAHDQLMRIINTATQTKKSRMERYQNMQNAFEISNNNALKNKHVIIIDDTITTGATIEACALELLKIEGVKVSLVLGAIAMH